MNAREDDDPLGYDTSDPNFMRQMARDALEGRNEDAVQQEIVRISARFGLPPKTRTRRQRVRRWLSTRWWRMRFWLKDRFHR